MNIHTLYKKEKEELNKVHYNKGGRGEFYGGDQLYSTGFNKKIQPFAGKAHKLNDANYDDDYSDDGDDYYDDYQNSKCKNCCYKTFKLLADISSWFKYL